ncbi:MAG: hypothetical protein IV086_05525 [Hyphomonadaceae bacterium]|nr:MAG: hypothetical protein FD160_125 [Caulobacteraceae bacterium]MBT9445138.1 hypothetical protein [Hyphomonadaceae bacterium]TPW02840.1 MAG: hypothetical protein FD124_3246 [Alphaproteobacteria bacterium]
MLGEPTAKQLVEATAGFLEKVAIPQLEGHAAFHARVAANVLAIVARELELGPAAADAEAERLAQLLGGDGPLDAQRRDLCARLTKGEMTLETPGLADHLLATAIDRVRIEQPNYGSFKRL